MRAFFRISLATIVAASLTFAGCGGDETNTNTGDTSSTPDTQTVPDTTGNQDTNTTTDVTLVTPDTSTPPQDTAPPQDTTPPPPVNTQAACQDFAVCVSNATTPEAQGQCQSLNPNGATTYLAYDTCLTNACGAPPTSQDPNDPALATWLGCKDAADRVGGACSTQYESCFTGSGNCIGIFSCFQACPPNNNLCLSQCIWAASYTAQEKFYQFSDCALDSCPDPCSDSVGSGVACTDGSECAPFETCDAATSTCLFTETSCSTCAQQNCAAQLMACQQDTGIGFFTAPNFQDPSMKPEHKELPFTMIQNMRLIDPFVGR